MFPVAAFDTPPSWYAGWGTLALVNAGLAQGKHRGGLNWFVVSLLLGPVATLILLLLDDPRDAKEPEPDR